jgi:ABC-2 type transport system ATP-binding protein
MTVIEFLRVHRRGARLRGRCARGGAWDARWIARWINGRECRHQRIETLSKGFKRRVGLAQAILHDPQVLILDEPTDGLDPNQKHQVRELIRGMSGEKIVIISTHILEEVARGVQPRTIIIARGRIVADGTPAELEARSRYHRSVHIHFGADMRVVDAFEAREALGALPGVAEVEAHANGRRLVVVAVPGSNPLPSVAHLVHDRGWEIDELHVERGRLDEVFRDITREVA